MRTEMKSCVITGGQGLVGRRLIEELPADVEAYVISHAVGEPLDVSSTPNVHLIDGDLRDPNLAASLPQKVDCIFHLAQSNRFRQFPSEALDIFEVNTLSTIRLLDYARCAGVRHFVYTSTGGVLSPSRQAQNEEAAIKTDGSQGFYAVSKLASEMMMSCYKDEFVLATLRPFFIYGPHQRCDMLIPRLIRNVADGQAIMLHDNDGIHINPIYVDDVVRCLFAASELQRSEVINVAGPEVLSLRQIAAAIGSALGVSPKFEVRHTASKKDLVADTDLMESLLGKAKVTCTEGLEKTIPFVVERCPA